MMRASFYVGLDLGQVKDPTAIAVIERAELQGEYDPVYFAYRKVVRNSVRYLERVPLGTPYPETIDRVREVIAQLRAPEPCKLVVDATGVGRPVVDMIVQARLECRLLPVVITPGQREGRDGEYCMVPKRDLIVNLQVMLQQQELKVAAKMEGMQALVKEMMGMQVKVGESGREQFNGREGEHDDLVLALAIGCWAVKRDHPGRGEGEYWGGPGSGRQGRLPGI